MNKIIKNQLDKVSVAKLPYYDDNTTSIIIPKLSTLYLKENCCYILKLDDIMLHPSENSVLVTNWNNNSIPTSRYYKADINQIMGKMVKITGLAYDFENKKDLSDIWVGWLVLDNIEILEKL